MSEQLVTRLNHGTQSMVRNTTGRADSACATEFWPGASTSYRLFADIAAQLPTCSMFLTAKQNGPSRERISSTRVCVSEWIDDPHIRLQSLRMAGHAPVARRRSEHCYLRDHHPDGMLAPTLLCAANLKSVSYEISW